MHEDFKTGETGPREHNLSARVENHWWSSLWDGDQSTGRPLLGNSAQQSNHQHCSPWPLQVHDAMEEMLTLNSMCSAIHNHASLLSTEAYSCVPV